MESVSNEMAIVGCAPETMPNPKMSPYLSVNFETDARDRENKA